MHPILKNILAVIAGWLIGSFVNLSLINLGHKLLPIVGLDINNLDAYAQAMPTLEFKYFIFPFLGHALGTLVGATVAGLIAHKHKMKFALAIGFLFLLGGIAINYMLQGPIWFTIIDLLFAYIPMAWLGGKIALTLLKKRTQK